MNLFRKIAFQCPLTLKGNSIQGVPHDRWQMLPLGIPQIFAEVFKIPLKIDIHHWATSGLCALVKYWTAKSMVTYPTGLAPEES